MASTPPTSTTTTTSSPIPDTLHLYTYFRSSCSARLRIALSHKGLTSPTILTQTYIPLLTAAHKTASYLSQNPSGTVPTLIITHPSTTSPPTTTITQSIAALEYLEDAYPHLPPLLPKDAVGRARVRELVNVIACDVQPVTNMHILSTIGSLGGDKATYAREKISVGLMAYEALLVRNGEEGEFSVGNELSLADVCLVPALWGAERWGVSLEAMPRVKRLGERLERVEAVRWGHWRGQEDTPEELRWDGGEQA